jgi:hypothetical protein
MADNFNTLWVQQKWNQIAEQRAHEAIQRTGRALPCSITAVNGSLVTVKFEVTYQFLNTTTGQMQTGTLPPLTLPRAEGQWARAPIQVGDVGMTLPADTLLGGISGQGTGTPDLSVQYPNLSTLVWIPVAATSFQTTPDSNKYWINGPNGFECSDSTAVPGSPGFGTVGIVGDKDLQTVTIYAGNQTIVITADPSIIATVIGTYGNLQRIVDGTTGNISDIVPAGGLQGLGALASSLSAIRALPAQADLTSLAQSIVQKSLQNLCVGLGAAAATTLTGGPAFEAIIAASGYVSGLSGILPVIPGCSSVVRVAP